MAFASIRSLLPTRTSSASLGPAVALVLGALAVSGCPTTAPPAMMCPRTCAAGLELCCPTATGANSCVSHLSDVANCGACGRSCGGAPCVSGVCAVGDTGPPRTDGGPRDAPAGICAGGVGTRTCPGGLTVNCSGYTGAADGEGGRTDPSFTNCAVCGVTCDPAQHNRCATPGGGLGTPRCLCGVNDCGTSDGDLCTLVTGTYRCIHTDTDEMNCGAVGTVCGAAEMCVGGMCVCNPTTMEVCGATETCCTSACVDLTSDEAHCGMCGMACPMDEECITAAGGPSECLCGGVACDADETCMGGTCVCNPTTGEICGAGQSCCGMACIDTTMDDANCGGCGITCGAMTTCNTVAGVTGCYCGTDVCTPPETTAGGNPGELCCDDGTGTGTVACVPQDGSNCGGCGMACFPTTDSCVLAPMFIVGTVGLCCSGDIVFGMFCPPGGP